MKWYLILAAFELYIFLNALFDRYKIRHEWRIMHGIEGTLQLIVILVFAWISPDRFFVNAFFYLSLFWLQFDYILNILRGLPWYHLGSAITDQILKSCENRYWRIGLKMILFIISIIVKNESFGII